MESDTVQELGTSVLLDIMGVKITPAKLRVDPVLLPVVVPSN